ncbi:MAG: hypothetical protein LBJ46_09550 [Planctomycetota bacterium]|jgi:hypothetical protein|nr:hypothetical protein [Planctomycetota bacterium]
MRFLFTLFYMVLSILGVSVIGFLCLIGVQYYRGKLAPADLHSIMRVIGGTNRIMIPNEQYERFVEFSKDEDAARLELEANRGLPETRVPAAMRAQEAEAAQRDNLEVLNRLLAAERQKVEEVRAEVEAQKLQVANLQRALNDEKEKNLIVEMDAATRKLRETLAGMDAEDVAAFLTAIVLDPSQGGPVEAARIIRDHLQSDFAAEVLTEMPVQERQRVIPLLENRFAGVPPTAVAQIFLDNNLSAGEQLAYLRQMNPQQALGVYLRLPPNIQEQISPELLRGN